MHGFPPHERTGVEVYTAALAAGLARRGHAVEVLAPRRAPDLPELSLRREERDGYGVNWLTTNAAPRGRVSKFLNWPDRSMWAAPVRQVQPARSA